MVAYSFRPRFVGPILVGLGRDIETWPGIRPKLQTIRAIGKRRHARSGEMIQLYTGMRTKECRKIGDAECKSVHKIEMKIGTHTLYIEVDGAHIKGGRLHEFAMFDGFDSGEDMLEFWHQEHSGVTHFEGVLIKW